jgi:adenylosuccinate synthase
VVSQGKQYILHLIPSGILKPDCQCIIGNGVVVDPESLEKEIKYLEDLGVEVRSRLFVSDTAHLVLPYHRLLDVAQEKARGKGKIGTTGRGIGCAYGDKVTRVGLRAGDLRSERRVREKVQALADFYGPIFENVYHEPLPSPSEVADQLMLGAKTLVPLLVDGSAWVNGQLDAKRKVLIEGAQGILLDIDHGTYPFVTSSNPSPGGVCAGLGLSPRRVDRIVGVAKAYTTRVGEGPMPTEFDTEFGEMVRKNGGEYGATTGRPRRCGWFDAPAVRRSILVGGIDEIMLTKIDVLDPLETLQIATAYRVDGRATDVFPSNLDPASTVEPIYEEMPGWKCSLADCKSYEELPENARRYIKRVEALLGVPISVVSVGADRERTICLRKSFFA